MPNIHWELLTDAEEPDRAFLYRQYSSSRGVIIEYDENVDSFTVTDGIVTPDLNAKHLAFVEDEKHLRIDPEDGIEKYILNTYGLIITQEELEKLD